MNIPVKAWPRAAACTLSLLALASCSEQKPSPPSTTQEAPTSRPNATGASAEPLPPEQAFPLKVEAVDATTLVAQFAPVPHHYLYRSQISFALKDAVGARVGAVALPRGLPKKDPFLGEQEVYRDVVQISVPLAREAGKPAKFTLVTTYQGCNEQIGLCYPPTEAFSDFNLP
ncbi:protein-disulfide reductase DsbD N-terminal domain-containing protein [Piscinibacter koreensis]|uniref:Protein-disulfide reductase DsbD N-terminal domain-containing protein n=1 Tax=Piscinibacter koreensis TaxID=2742824 RepID=A0A7Y6NS89_9BURK|nr:protein-disulfide reductase DsbD N-terminal domain-containing protein [Schlegelella koreensis]NUZ08401.1 protein-disulfide reductase DsbD N-terminal domain-containing protein [Schlegelella koreensis]